LRILVADDEPDFVVTCVRLLALKGHATLTAGNALDAIAKIHADRPDLVITDLRLGPHDGWTVVEHARRIVPALPVIVVTGHPAPDAARRARQAGAELLPKPVSPAELTAAIDRLAPRSPGASL
jgi:two-component system, cell cycle sensor histidine kinase and response regulator CckA